MKEKLSTKKCKYCGYSPTEIDIMEGTFYETGQVKSEFITKLLHDQADKTKEKIKGMMFMYEHHAPKYTDILYCEDCEQFVDIGSPCKASRYYPFWKDLNNLLETIQ